ncbi:MAG: HAD-IIIA family hydrolase [Proteobacteria bacterium]|nr:HAD-IIIA family hydrolase [Pseudomonadota bacterium]MCP4921521.1 HAD-IIIA family hydrolase [Pseudomonadota bacterium]
MLERQGRLLSPDEIKAVSRTEPNLFPPRAVFAFGQRDEAPSLDEGFKTLERVEFSRRDEGFTNRGIICDLDGTVRTSRPAPFPRRPEEIRILPNRSETLKRYAADGWLLLGVTNQAGVAMGMLSELDVIDCITRTVELLDVEMDVRYCPHRAGGTHCWCRKPMPGLGVQLIREYQLDRAQCIFVGDRKSDGEFARNVGFQYQVQADFFGA